MKKSFAIALALCMILSVCFISVSAAEATIGSVAADYKPAEGAIAVTNEAEFLAMAADGNYYLANDITIAATWNAGAAASSTYKENTAFTGTFDGNGKVVTTSAPLFANLKGTVKNLTVEGAIDGGGLHCANVSMWTNGTFTVDNVYSKADITNGKTTGGILGYCATGTNATITNCRNDANINCTDQVGGIVGYIQDDVAAISGCVNYGNLRTENYGAGIIGRFGRNAAALPDSIITIDDCVNYGSVSSAAGQSAGILAYMIGGGTVTNCENYGEISNDVGISAGIVGTTQDGDFTENSGLIIKNCANYAPIKGITYVGGICGYLGRGSNPYTGWNYRIENSANYGDLTAEGEKKMYVGGIAAYGWGGSFSEATGLANGLLNCVNVGNINANSTGSELAYVSGIIGYFNSAQYNVVNCVNAGTITTNKTENATLIAFNNRDPETAGTTAEFVMNNYSVANGEIPAFYNGPVSESVGCTAVTADQLASGEVAYLINEAAGATVYYQAIGTDKVPTLAAAEDGSNTVLKKDDGSYGNPVTDPVDPAPTGDSALAFAVIALISVFGVAMIAKRREN